MYFGLPQRPYGLLHSVFNIFICQYLLSFCSPVTQCHRSSPKWQGEGPPWTVNTFLTSPPVSSQALTSVWNTSMSGLLFKINLNVTHLMKPLPTWLCSLSFEPLLCSLRPVLFIRSFTYPFIHSKKGLLMPTIYQIWDMSWTKQQRSLPPSLL